MQLYFVPTKLPRTMTRQEWKECDRWRRVTQKVLKAHEDEIMKLAAEMATNACMYGSSESDHVRKMRDDLYASIINPPLLLGPHMDQH